MKIYTKTGDKGKTSLFNGSRVHKHSLRVETYGTVDELNSVIGLALAHSPQQPIVVHLEHISRTLFTLGTDLATPVNPEPKFPVKRLTDGDTSLLEAWIDDYTAKLPDLKNFILPGGEPAAAFLHQARTVCRRAERLISMLAENEEINSEGIIFINRLSDYLFTAARYQNFLSGNQDVIIK